MLRRVVVQGSSMEPTLRAGQRLLVLTWPRREPRRGEVWVLRHPTKPLLVAKRIHEVLGPGVYFVRGDNPDASTDSRSFGPLRASEFVGRALCGYRPFARVR